MKALIRIYIRMIFLVSIFCTAFYDTNAQTKAGLNLFRLQEVQLLPSPFKDAEQTDVKYMLALNADRLLAPYWREAGLPRKAESYTNWENTGLDGHIGGHYLSALAMMYASTGNKELLRRLNYMVDELKICQDAFGDGYIGGVPGSKEYWAEIRKGNIAAQNKKWVPLYNIHKVYAGLRDAYLYAGNEKAKVLLIRFSDWFVNLSAAIGAQKMEEMLRTEHGGINEVLADVYGITGEKKYLDAAYSFSHKAILEPLENCKDKLNNLHANTQIPKVIGFKRIADVNRDSTYNKAAHFFWETVVTHRTVAIGGNSVREHFNPENNFSSMINSEQGPETCNTYNMLKLTRQLYLTDESVKYIDYYERALYNHILSTELPGKGGFVYFTPMRPGHYRVYSQPETSMWCCVGSGMENHAKYSELIYAHDKDNLYVNLFIPSRLQWKQKGVSLNQQTRFPEEERTSLVINSVNKQAFTINIRYPSWVMEGEMRVSVNGQPVKIVTTPASYIAIKKVWKKGDKIDVQLPMKTTTEKLPDGLNYVAVVHGPIVLAAKTDTANMAGLFANDSRMGHVANGTKYPMNKMPMFVINDSNITSHIIPLKGVPLTFKTQGLIYPVSYQSLELIPFYKVHDSRYVVYWQQETPQILNKILQQLAAEEDAAAKLTAITVDVVKAGEQQPESDHFLESENSNAGTYQDRHYREAKGWFSYKLTNKEKTGKRLRITYYGLDKDRHFMILVNGEVIAEVYLDGSHGNEFYTIEYPIPEKLVSQAGEQYIVKFLAQRGSITGSIYEVRLLKE